MANLKSIKVNVNVDTTDIPMSDEVKNEWVNDPLDKMLDKWLSSGSSEMRLINLEDKHMRILKGWTREERKELEEADDSGYNSAFDVIYGIIKLEGDLAFIIKKYDEGSSLDNDQLAKDIVDFYCGRAKFPEQKYVLETTTPQSSAHTYIKDILGSTYGGIGTADKIKTTSNKEEALVLSKNTIVQKLGGKYMAFAVPVEEVED